jgi:non-ribosomal peptide synthetase component E (peptide arylation enzyme)
MWAREACEACVLMNAGSSDKHSIFEIACTCLQSHYKSCRSKHVHVHNMQVSRRIAKTVTIRQVSITAIATMTSNDHHSSITNVKPSPPAINAPFIPKQAAPVQCLSIQSASLTCVPRAVCRPCRNEGYNKVSLNVAFKLGQADQFIQSINPHHKWGTISPGRLPTRVHMQTRVRCEQALAARALQN